MRGGIFVMTDKEKIIEELKNTDDKTLLSAYLYGKNLALYGVNVLEPWVTAVTNSVNLEKAYAKGYYEGLKRATLATEEFLFSRGAKEDEK